MNKSLSVVVKSFVCLFFLVLFLSCEEEKKAVQSEVAQTEGTEAVENKEEEKAEEIKKEELPPPTAKEIGYAYGVILAKAVQMNHLDVDAKSVYKGYSDSLGKGSIDISAQEKILKRAFAEGKKKYARENLAKEEAFLEKNKSVEGVITLESGLQYKVLKKGDENSEKPAKGSKVKVIYSGKTLGAEHEFDSSQGEAIELSLENVIEGWREVVPLMNVGDEIEVYIPSRLGYGEEGISYSGQEIIPPSALLIFKMELKEIISEVKKEGENTSENGGNAK